VRAYRRPVGRAGNDTPTGRQKGKAPGRYPGVHYGASRRDPALSLRGLLPRIPGAASYEKFLSWARTIENLIGNPLYHWTHLELQRYFGIYEPLTTESAPAIWEKANALLQTPDLCVKGIFEKFKIYAVGTTDDPADSLEHHHTIAAGTAQIGKISTKVIPSFRPDKALEINAEGFSDYIDSLSRSSGIAIKTTDDVLAALEKRLDFFIEAGCRSSDHGLEYAPYKEASSSEIEESFKKAMAGKKSFCRRCRCL